MSRRALAAVECRKTVTSAKTAHLQSRYWDRFLAIYQAIKPTEPMNYLRRRFSCTQARSHRTLRTVTAITLFALFVAVSGLGPKQSLLNAALQDNADQRIFETASLAQNNQSYDFAIKEWDKILADHPDSELVPRANYNAGVCSLQLGQYEKAINYFQTASPKLDAESGLRPKADLFLGFAQYRHGRALKQNQAQAQQQQANKLLTTATQTFANLRTTTPEFEEIDQACFFQGGAYEELGRDQDAVKSYTQMLTYPKQTFKYEGLFALADAEARLGQYSTALEHYNAFRNAAKSDGGHPLLQDVDLETGRTLIRLAVADEKSGNRETANQKLSQAIEILAPLSAKDRAKQPTDEAKLVIEEARFQHAFCESRLGRHEKSAGLYESIASNSNSPRATQSLVNAGRNYINAGQIDKAAVVLEKSLATDSKYSADAAHWLAQEVYLKSKPAQAQKAYDLATAWIGKLTDGSTKADASKLVPLKMDQANAIYAISERRQESIPLYQAIVDQHADHALAPQSLYNAAFASLEQGDYKTAIVQSAAFEQAYSESDFLADTLEIKADALMLDQRPELALKVFDELADKFSDNQKVTRWKLGAARSLYIQKEYQPTIDKLKSFLDSPNAAGMNPDTKAEALHWIGSSQFNLKDFANATDTLASCVQLSDKWRRADETLLTLCQAQMANKQMEEGKQTASTMIATFPSSPLLSDLYYHLGRQAYQARDFDEAIKNFDQITQNYSDSRFAPYALYDAAWSQMELKKFDESEKLFAQLMSKFPEHELAAKSKVARGASLRKTGDTKASITELKEFMATDNATGQSRANALFEIGLNQVELKKWDDSIDTFKQLISEFPESPKLDRFYYELAWAYNSKSEKEKGLEYFTKITTEKPDSPLAGESNFHIGSSEYDAGKFDDAIKSYTACLSSKAEDHVREKAAYKLAWAHYKQDQFQPALKAFTTQTDSFPDGDLYSDGLFMVAESQFRLKNHQAALAGYQKAQPIIEASQTIEPKIKWLTMLHGAQSANQAKQYDTAIKLASGMEASDADITFKQDASLELGVAHAALSQPEQAMENYRKAAENLGRTGARARCMIGDMHFANKNFRDAENEFKLVYFGFGGPQAAEDVKPWQAYAIYEAARCNFVQVKTAPAESKPKLITESIRQFEYLIKNYPNDKLAPEAKRQLETLSKLKK